VNPSNPIVNLVNMATMVTMANVPEREVGKLRVGSRALVQVDAYGEQRFTGRIARIAPVLDPATRTATVEVEIPNSNGGLKAEMFARVTIDLASQRAAVLIPREALVYRGQQAGVYVMQDKRPVFRTVETGLTRGDDVEVLANLQAGATIVTRGATMLNEGDQIRIAPMSERRTAADTNTQLTNN
jgi:RND family efflux transporter MFP subunit